MIDIESKIISYREDTNDYRLCLTREEIEEIKNAWNDGYCQGATDMEETMQIIIDSLLKQMEQIRAEVIEEVMKRAESIQLEQIENLNKSTRRNGKMWARYMSTYLGHIQVACKRMLELKEQNK